MKLSDLQNEKNIANLLSEEELNNIGHSVLQTYEADKNSRSSWEKKMKDAMDLALQITKEKSWPWRNASNVKFPLLTIAALQFASRVYPSVVKAPDLVKYRVQGSDPDGAKAAMAQRISSHMSYQLLEEDEGWEEEHDKALLALPILGCVFKKTYFDSVKGHNCSKLVLPMDLVVHYYAKSVEECGRKTEVFKLYERDIRERVLKGIYKEYDLPKPSLDDPEQSSEREGTMPPADDPDRPRTILEQHTFLDLDKDKYPEPYVVTVDKDSKKVFRIVARFKEVVTEQALKIEENNKRIQEVAQSLPNPESLDAQQQMAASIVARRAEATITRLQAENQDLESQKPKVLRIVPVEYYTKIPFIPSPDGGFYDIGFGALLGPLNASVDTIINQLVDSGTLNNSNAGFIGKGARIKGGRMTFEPNEWKRVDVAGGVLRDSIVPLPVNQPSAVLFQLLGLLIDYTQRVSSVTEAMSGDNPGQNTPAYNMSAMLEQGLQVFNGIFKRVYRAFRGELRKIYSLNAIYLNESEYFEYHDVDQQISRNDYKADPKDLIPAADPNAFSAKEKQMKAAMIAERSQMTAGYDPIKVEQRLLEAMDIPDAAEVFPVQQNPETGRIELVYPPAPNPEIEIALAEEQRRSLDAKNENDRKWAELEGKLAVMEADVVLKMASAKKLGEDVELARFEMILSEIQNQRKAALESKKIKKDAKEES